MCVQIFVGRIKTVFRKDEETEERKYKIKYMQALRANSVILAQFPYEDGSCGAEVISPFLDGFLGFHTTDGYAVYKIFDSKQEASKEEKEGKKGEAAVLLVQFT